MAESPVRPPSEREINPLDDLDGKVAAEHFLGKSLAEAKLLFVENSINYQEDLLWMGPKAFCFYVTAAIDYIESEHAAGDSDIVSCFRGILEFRMNHDRDEIAAVVPELRRAANYILNNWKKFKVDPELDGDLRSKYQELLRRM